jgi:hypothetical protein
MHERLTQRTKLQHTVMIEWKGLGEQLIQTTPNELDAYQPV